MSFTSIIDRFHHISGGHLHPEVIRIHSLAAIVFVLFCSTVAIAETPITSVSSERGKRAAIKPLHSRVLPSHVDPSSTESVDAFAQAAYVWAWPMVYLHNCREALSRLPAAGRSAGAPVAPPNHLSMLTDVIAAGADLVACPNQDTAYGFALLDLRHEPVVLQIPDFGDRFWLIQIGDQRTEGFADIGRMHGTQSGFTMIVGPNWNGEVPPGIGNVLHSPTQLAYILPRVFVDDTDADRAAVAEVVSGLNVYPLSKYTGQTKRRDWSRTKWYPRVGSNSREQSRWVNPQTFFRSLRTVLDEVPPQSHEEPFVLALRQLLDTASQDAELSARLVAAAHAAEQEIVRPMFDFNQVGETLPHHWHTVTNGADFGEDYVTRTAVARSNIFVNRNHETKYFYLDNDAAGRRLNGNRSYRLTFKADELPDVKGFWSLTLYDADHKLAANDEEIYSVGSRSRDLKFNPDGSLTIIVSNERPEDDEYTNWLPAPSGEFSLYIRAYWPGESMVSGQWTPPAVRSQSQVILTAR